tara:strand:+ start:2341 stop:3261 length:921 start_codon:yes stop_codon:yes gene_type:complete
MSLVVLKRKTQNGNPRQSPISGSNNSKFGFSINGRLRGNYILKDPILAGRPKICNTSLGTSEYENSNTNLLCSCSDFVPCTPSVKPSVLTTQGMLAKKLRGYRNTESSCNKPGNGPLSLNWVKQSSTFDSSQSNYIKNVVSVNTNILDASSCNLTKSFNGILGVLDQNGLDAINNLPQGCQPTSNLSKEVLETLVKNQSIMPNESLCSRLNKSNLSLNNSSKKVKCFTSKPGIVTISSSDYISKRLLVKNYLPWQQQKSICNQPQPNELLSKNCRETSYNSNWNNNLRPASQIYFDSTTNKWKFNN